jgi:uncharacterized membrane protein
LTATFRRRVDNVVLRWQARLDSEWSDRTLPWIVALALFVLLVALSLAKARSLDGTQDLSIYTQAAWLIRHALAPNVTFGDAPGHLLAQQAAFVFYPMTAIDYVLPIIPGLLVLQSAALALAVVPLWRIGRKLANLRVGAVATLSFVYAFYPVMHNLNLDGFHPEVLAVPALLCAFYFAETDRWKSFAVFAVLVVACRADLGLVVAGMGLLFFIEGKRRKGAVVVTLALAYTLAAVIWIQPDFGNGTFPHLNAFSEFGNSPGSVAWGMINHPFDVLGRLTSEQNFNLVVTLFAPVLFLPFLAPRYLIPIVPLQVLYMVADVPREAVFGQQTVAVTAFIFIASAFALSRIGRMGVEKVHVDHRVLAALLLAGCVFFIRDAASSPYREPWNWGGQDAVDGVRIEAREEIPSDAAVRASPSMLQELAERERLYVLDTDEVIDARQATDGVDVVVLDARTLDDWSPSDREAFYRGMAAEDFRVTVNAQGIVVFQAADAPALPG